MKILHVTPSISRYGGGITEVVRGLTGSGGWPSDMRQEVFSLADAFSERDRRSWPQEGVRLFESLGPDSIGFSPSLMHAVVRGQFDLLHMHGIWNLLSWAGLGWQFFAGKPSIISTHGMLDAWALRQSKWRKRIALSLYEGRHLHGASCLHALCLQELDALRALGLRNPVCVIPNGVHIPSPHRGRSHQGGQSIATSPRAERVLYLGRLHPKKGIAHLLRAWARCKDAGVFREGEWLLQIAGWDQAGHERTLRRLAQDLHLGETVEFCGPLFGDQKVAAMTNASLFVLPSVSEGLPMSVLEAWSYSLPVLMTKECNLSEGFTAGAAIEIHPDVQSIASNLSLIMTMPAARRTEIGARGYELVGRKYSWASVSERMSLVYRWVVGHAPIPPEVSMP